MVMKVLLLRANNLRHEALSSTLQAAGYLSAEIVESKATLTIQDSSVLISQHFMAREQSEKDFFQFLKLPPTIFPRLDIKFGELNSSQVLSFVKNVEFDIAITFGVSILKPALITELRNAVLGIHLGLSPYYRGSGTNFFPFVDSELAAIGYTLMHLNHEIDKGPIIHQGRAPIVLGDSIHTIGNRNISKMFEDIVELLRLNVNLSIAKNPLISNGKLYKRKDFTEDKLKNVLVNLDSGLISTYLSSQENFLNKYPIIQHGQLWSESQ
jgi:folate-dependent phosphoribosylglycinamide formyltransferase PurN